MKKLFFSTFCIAIACVGVALCCFSYSHSSFGNDLMMENVEALSNTEGTVTVSCEGNTNICAKGVDQNTGHDFVIHGKLKF